MLQLLHAEAHDNHPLESYLTYYSVKELTSMVTNTTNAKMVHHGSCGLLMQVRWHATTLCSTSGWTRKQLILELGQHAKLGSKADEVLVDELHLKRVVRCQPHH
jgi:hypothetical protein